MYIGIMLNINAHIQINCRQCLAVVFLPLLEKELRQFVRYWNSHLLRCNRMTDCPQGIPDDLYNMPGHFGGENYLQPVDAALWMHAMLNDARPADPMFTEDMYRDCHDIVQAQFGIDLQRQVTASNAVEIYKFVISNI